MNIKHGLTAILGKYLISALAGEPVIAATIGGTIKVNVVKVTESNFAGVYTGDFSYDDTHLTKVGTESMTVNGGNGERPGLLSLNFRFLALPNLLCLMCARNSQSRDWARV